MGTTRFQTHSAPARLRGAVRELWELEDDGRFVAALPKPYVDLVVSVAGVHWWRARPDSEEIQYSDAWVTPVQDGPRYARSDGGRLLIGARFEPWAAQALFGALPRGDGAPPPLLASLIGDGAYRLRAWLLEAQGQTCRFRLMTEWLMAQVPLNNAKPPTTVNPAAHCTASSLADDARIAPRSLRRRFALDAGISPKQWLQLHRLDQVLRDEALRDSGRPLADVAYMHGFADQAHFCREIARLTGETPRKLRWRERGLPPHLVPMK